MLFRSGVRQCASPALAVALLTSLGALTSPTDEMPPNWPTSFPRVPGGTPRSAPPMGPVRVGLLAYPGREPASLRDAYRDALTAAGWTLDDSRAGGDEAIRFTAAREGASVSVSVYRDGTGTIVQTMQLAAAGAQ